MEFVLSNALQSQELIMMFEQHKLFTLFTCVLLFTNIMDNVVNNRNVYITSLIRPYCALLFPIVPCRR